MHRNDLRWKLQNLHFGRSKLHVVLDATSRDICRQIIDEFEVLCAREEFQECKKGTDIFKLLYFIFRIL